MQRIEIYGIPVSNYVRSVRMALEEKGLDYDLVDCLPHSEVPSQIHPLGRIPVMRHGELELGESRAIVGYLDRLFPETPLFPDDPTEYARTEQWVWIVHTAIDRTMVREYVLGYRFAEREGREPDRQAIDAAAAIMRRQVGLLDKAVSTSGYLAAGRFTYADITLMPILAAIQGFPEGAKAVAEAPSLKAYFNRHSERPSFAATQPSFR